MEKAIQHYEQASDYFRGEENNSSANKCLLKVAMFAAQMENYEKAIQIYEQVGSIIFFYLSFTLSSSLSWHALSVSKIDHKDSVHTNQKQLDLFTSYGFTTQNFFLSSVLRDSFRAFSGVYINSSVLWNWYFIGESIVLYGGHEAWKGLRYRKPKSKYCTTTVHLLMSISLTFGWNSIFLLLIVSKLRYVLKSHWF